MGTGGQRAHLAPAVLGHGIRADPKSFSGVGAGSFLGLDSWRGVSTSGWGSGLVGIECANAQNSYCELLGGIRRRIPGGVVRKLGGYNPPGGCRKLPG